MTTTTHASGLGIRTAGSDDEATVATTVAAAFYDDPVLVWLVPDPVRRQEIVVPMFRLYAEAYLRLGETYVTADGKGAALWLPPGAELLTPEQEAAFGDAVVELMGPDAAKVAQLEETFAEHHPSEPLWYLNFLATVPAFQGRGYGSALMRIQLERADRDGTPAYHEATTPRNRALYERHGYVSQGEFRLPDDGPPLWRMWRDPQ